MKLLLFTLLLLTACGQSGPSIQSSPNPFEQQSAGLNGGGNGLPLNGGCPIAGHYTNQGNGMTAIITTHAVGYCRVQLSCGAIAWLFDTGGNTYLMMAEAGLGDTMGSCNVPTQSTNYYDSNGGFHSGNYKNITFGQYSGQWLGSFTVNQANNQWIKQ